MPGAWIIRTIVSDVGHFYALLNKIDVFHDALGVPCSSFERLQHAGVKLDPLIWISIQVVIKLCICGLVVLVAHVVSLYIDLCEWQTNLRKSFTNALVSFFLCVWICG